MIRHAKKACPLWGSRTRKPARVKPVANHVGRVGTLKHDLLKYGKVYKGTRLRISCPSPHWPNKFEFIGIDTFGRVIWAPGGSAAIYLTLALDDVEFEAA